MTPDNLDAVQVLDWYDGPRAQVLRDRVTGDLYYAHWARDVGDHEVWMLVPVTAERLRLLGDAVVTPRELLTAPREPMAEPMIYAALFDGERWLPGVPVPVAYLDPSVLPDAAAFLPRDSWWEKELRP